jgi:hypothetical protein
MLFLVDKHQVVCSDVASKGVQLEFTIVVLSFMQNLLKVLNLQAMRYMIEILDWEHVAETQIDIQ